MGAVPLALASAFPREALRKDRHQELKEPPNHRVEGNPADVWIIAPETLPTCSLGQGPDPADMEISGHVER